LDGLHWQHERGLGDQVATLTVTGGTGNAILASPQPGIDLTNVVAAILVPSATNTAAVTINGTSVNDSEGNPLIAGAFAAGKSYFLWVRPTEYRAVFNEFGSIGDIAGLQDALNSKLDDNQLDTDLALTADSHGKIASQKAVKSYVDAAISAIKGGVSTAFDTLLEVSNAIATKFDKVGGTLTGNLILQLVSPTLRLNHTGVNDWGILNHTDGKLYVQKLSGTPVNALAIGVDGSISTAQLGDLNTRIEARSQAWANDRIANLQYRKVSLGYNGTSGGYSNIGGTVVVGYARDAGVSGQVNGLYYMYLQVFDPVRGWVGFSG